MQFTPIHRAIAKHGKLEFLDTIAFSQFLSFLPDGEYDVTVKKHRKSRSNNQNSYLWGVVYQLIADETGHSPEEVHDAMKIMFLQKQGVLKTLRSTADLSTIEFEDYVRAVRVWASQDLGLFIPLPNETEFI